MAKLASTTVYGNLNVLETINSVNEILINNGVTLLANEESFKYKNKDIVTVDGANNTTFDINVLSANKLKTARTINGTNFDGTGNITTANWGTARTLTIGSTGKSVNGSANVSWSLAELGLGNVNNTADSAKNVLSATKLTTARTIGGVSFDGTANINLPGVNIAGNQSTTGNANSATVLQNARTINGTNFNGSANITTANWGTARNIQIGNTTKSVNGSGNVSWSLNEIGALKKQFLIEDTEFDFNTIQETGFYASSSDSVTNNWKNKPCNGGFTWVVIRQLDSRTQQIVWNNTNQCWSRYQNVNSGTHAWSSWERNYTNLYKPLADAATKLQTARTIGGVSFDGTANINLPGVNTAGNQSTSGNAATATKLQTARTINGTNFDGTGNIVTANWGTARNLQIGNTAKSVNGSGNVAWSLSEIGAAAASHTHDDRYRLKNRTLFLKADVPESVWTSAPDMAGKTSVGGMDVNTGTGTDGYLSLSSSTSKLHMFIDGEIWTNEGRNRVYTTGYKPSKADVGLGSVNNWGASSSISANSTAEYATTNMVAQVRAEKLNLSGGTMSGTLTHRSQMNIGTHVRMQDAQYIHCNPSTDGGSIGFLTKEGVWSCRVNNAGHVYATKVFNAVWNDYAEYFPKLETTITEAGDIIALSFYDDGEFYELATEEHFMIVGAHSDQYGHLIGGENPPEEFNGNFTEWNDSKFIPVGLVGRLPVKFIGEAKKGMKVVPSHIPGVGRKFDSTKDDYDKVIGYIVENNNDEGIRRVKIKIGK